MTKRWLPEHVYEIEDRHGKLRYRFRRGKVTGYIKGEPGSEQFLREYHELKSREPIAGKIQSPTAATRGSFDDLFKRFKKTPRWQRQKPHTQYVASRIIERFCDRTDSKGRYGSKSVAGTSYERLERILADMHETPAAANNLRDQLIRLFDFAIKMKWRPDNPARLTEAYKKGKGYHTWTDAEIEQYRAKHDRGTMARLVLELALNTAARRCNIVEIERDHIRNGKIAVDHAKNGDATLVRIMAETQAAIDALPAAPIRHLVVTQYGKPFTTDGLGNKMQQWTREAGLPKGRSLHGLRKAMSRMLAESNSTDAQGRAVTGQKKNETFAYYAAAANREALAEDALSNLEAAQCPTKKETE